MHTIAIVSLLGLAGPVFAAPPEQAFSPVSPMVESKPQAELGKKLFQDKRLSSKGNVSCQSCHNPSHAYSQPYVSGLDTPSLLNVSMMNLFFWNGRTSSLKEAIKDNLSSPNMLGNNPNQIEKTLKEDAELSALFEAHYQDGVSFDNVVDSLKAYLETLTTPNAKFDQYLKGNAKALNQTELKGYQLFVSYGCISCHQGKNMGGNITEKMGIYDNYFLNPAPYDLGLYQITKDEGDKYAFRVPSLRNVALTAPYFHDGSAKTLEAAIKQMAHYQLNRDLRDDEIQQLAAFLKTLTGEAPK